jgi:hypothetical protein
VRRRVPSRVERPAAPAHIAQMNFGFRHFAKPGEPMVLDGPWRALWRKARDEWCLTKGCHRTGKTCAEAFQNSRMERPCGADERVSR